MEIYILYKNYCTIYSLFLYIKDKITTNLYVLLKILWHVSLSKVGVHFKQFIA